MKGRKEDWSEELTEQLLETASKSEKEGVLVWNGYRCYFRRLNEELLGIMRTDNEDYDNGYAGFIDNIYTMKEILNLNRRDGENFFFMTSGGAISDFYDNKHIGKRINELFQMGESSLFTWEQYDSSELQAAKFENRYYLLISRQLNFEGRERMLYYAVSLDEILVNNCMRILVPVILVMSVCLLIYLFYIRFLRMDRLLKRENITRGARYKALTFAAIVTGITVTAAYYVKTMDGLGYFIENYQDVFDKVRSVKADSETCLRDLQTAYDEEALQEAQMISGYLSRYPGERTPEVLARLSELFERDFILMFDTEGDETVTDSLYIGYSICPEPGASSCRFVPLKHGVPFVIGPLEYCDLTNSKNQIVGVTTKDLTNHVDGFLQLVFYPDKLEYALKIASLNTLFDQSVITSAFDCFLIDSETNTFTYAPDSGMIGKTAQEYGIDEENIRNDYSEYMNVNGHEYFMSSTAVDDQYLYVGMQAEDLFDWRNEFVLLVLGLFLIDLILLTVMEYKSVKPLAKQTEGTADGSEEKQSEQGMVYMLVRNEMAMTLSPVDRLKQKIKEMPSMNAEEKIGAIVFEIVLVLAVVIYLLALLRGNLFPSNSIYSYILDERWPRGINVFSVSAALITAVSVFVAIYFIKVILRLFSKTLTTRVETVCNLLESIAEYGGAIFAIYTALGYFGVDVRALSASVGFLALIIGFGAKSLITDIVAGIFIIFEQEFHVGDIIEINGFRGMVKEIGLRTTKLISWDKNVKIINNHDVNNVVNLSMRNSFAVVDFTIPVTNSIEEIDVMFREELPKLKEKYPQIIGEPVFAGVQSFSGRKMACRIYAEVRELERGEMERILHRELQEILKRHNIDL